MQILLFVIGFALSCVAAFYSVTGLAHIFVGAYWPVIIMGSMLELSKLAGASWVFRNWRTAPKMLTGYVTAGVVLLMLLSGIGTFGYLTRAYLIQQAPMTALVSSVESAERGVALAQDAYKRDQDALTSYFSKNTADELAQRLIANNRTNGATNLLKNQQAIQTELQGRLSKSSVELLEAERQLNALKQQTQEQSVDVGPLLFVAQAWYGETTPEVLNKVVTWFTLLVILVFDPMAIALILASQTVSTKKESVFVPFVQEVGIKDPPSETTVGGTLTGYYDSNGDFHEGGLTIVKTPWLGNNTPTTVEMIPLTANEGVAPLTTGEGVAPLTIGKLRWPEFSTERTLVTTADGQPYAANYHVDMQPDYPERAHADAHADVMIEGGTETRVEDLHTDTGIGTLEQIRAHLANEEPRIIPEKPTTRSRAADSRRIR